MHTISSEPQCELLAPPKFNVIGVGVSIVNMKVALKTIDGWIANQSKNFVCIRDVNGVMHCRKDNEYKRIHDNAGLVTPDGMPIIWLARLMGIKDIERVCGSDLMAALCEQTMENGYKHFFYGGKPDVVERLAANLRKRYPHIRIAGTYSPPFRPLTGQEEDKMVAMINHSRADIVWVGLGSPKQEYWMAQHAAHIDAAVLIGVGAAFDFLAGTGKRAPVWMQRSGLEWLYRLLSEPRRLWRRYLTVTPRFIPLALLQLWRLRHTPTDTDPMMSSGGNGFDRTINPTRTKL